MAEETLKDKTAKGLFWGGFSTFLQQFIGMFFGIIIARILNPDDYGLVAMLAIFSAIANTIMDSGFTTALINKKTIRHEDYNAVFWFSAFCGIVIYVILFFAAPLIAQFYNQAVLTNLSRILFLSFLLSSLGIAHNALLFKQLKVKQRGFIDISAVFVSGLIGIILALSGFTFWGLAIQAVSQSLTSTILRWYFSAWRPSLSFDLSPVKKMFGFSSNVLFNNILGQINMNFYSLILGRYYTITDTGYYSQGNKWMLLGNTIISGMIQNVAQPIFVEVESDKERQRKIFRKLLRFGAFVSFPALLGLAFIAREFVLISIGEKWLGVVPYLQILSIMSSFGFITLLYFNLFYSYGKSNIVLYGSSIFYSANLLLGICLTSFGVFYLVVGCSVLSIIINFIWCFVGREILKIGIYDLLRDISPYLITTIMTFYIVNILLYDIDNLFILLFLKIAISILLYSLVLWITNSVLLKEVISFFIDKIK